MSVNFSCKGLYINLDRSVERRQAMEDQLRRIRLADRYERFAAIDAPDVADHGRILPGEAACFHSHYQALMKVKSSGSAVHILEDDVLLSPRLGEAAHAIVTSNFFNGYDVIFTDTFVHTDVLQLASYKEAFDHATSGGKDSLKYTIIDLENRYLASMTSYFVAPNAIDKILGIFREELARGPRMPVDICMRRAAQEKRIKAGCWFPFVTSLILEHVLSSTIAGRESQHGNPTVMLPALLRYSFFVDRDLDGYGKRFLDAMLGNGIDKRADAHTDFILTLLSIIVSGRFQSY